MVARVTPGRLDVFLETPFHAGSFRGFGRRDRNLRMQEEGGGSAAASPRRRGGAGRPEGRPGLPGVDRLARRLRQRRDPPADRGLPAQAGLPGRLPRQGGRHPLRDRPAAVPGDATTRPRARWPSTRRRSPTRRRRWRATGPWPPRRPSASRSSTTPRRRSARRRPTSRARGRPSRRRSSTSAGRRSSPRSTASRASPSPRSATSSTGQTVMTTVSQVDPIKVYFNPSEQEYLTWVAKHGPPEKTLSDKGSLEKGPLELILSDGSVFPHRGKAFLVGREVDVKTGTIQLAGAFPNPGNLLRPGQYAKVRVAMDVKKGAILVPQRAVNELQGSYQVAVVGADNKATIKVVKTVGPRRRQPLGHREGAEARRPDRRRGSAAGAERDDGGAQGSPGGRAGGRSDPRRGGGQRAREVGPWARSSSAGRSSRSSSRSSRRWRGTSRCRSSRPPSTPTSCRPRSRSRRPTRARTRSRSSSRWRRRSSSR